MADESQAWINTAKQDLSIAKHLLNAFHPMPIEVICYHAQQAAEKAVKALIIFLHAGDTVPKVHDISYLLNILEAQLPVSEECFDCADTLTPYGVAVRYPNELFLEAPHAKKAIECAETILSWAEKILE